MFNGGTRKRLMSSPISSSREINPSNLSSTAKKLKETVVSSSNPTQTSQYPIRSGNMIHSFPVTSNMTSSQQSQSVNSVAPIAASNQQALRAPASIPQELPFSLSRSFMIDYMWHHQQQQQTGTSVNAPTVVNKASHFQFPPYSALNWIKQPPPSFLFKPNGNSIALGDDKPPAFNHFHSAFKPVINMRLNDDVNSVVNPSTQSPSSSTSSNYNQTTASSTNQSDDEALTPVKKSLFRKRHLKAKNVYADDENSNQGEKIYIGDCFDGNTKDQMTSDDENEMVDIETTEDDIQILNLQPFKVPVEVEHENEIEVSDEKFTELENNNSINSYEHETESSIKTSKQPRSPIKSLKEIVNRSDRGVDEYFEVSTKRSHRSSSPYYQDWTTNLKKEVNIH